MMEAVGLVDPALVEQAAGPARRHSASNWSASSQKGARAFQI